MPTVLVTGANKGIGLEFVRQYAAKGFKVIAAVRDVTTMPPIEEVQTYKIDATSLTDAHIVAGKLKALGIQIDVLIANAAVNLSPSYLVDIPPATFDLTFKTNVQGPLILFQAMRPLMKYPAKFIVITSGSGTINRKMAVGKGAYGMTKAAINYMANTVRKLHFEHPELLVAALDPGRVHTDGGVKSAAWSGSTNAREPVETPVRKLIQLVDEGDKERLGGWVTTCNGARLDF